MAVKGTQAKQDATQKILNLFPNSFVYEKEIRLPYEEDGETIQLKCVLTCAKTNVREDDNIAIPGEIKEENIFSEKQSKIIMPTQEEKDNVKNLLVSFGL